MKTEDLVALLATNAGPTDPAAPARRYAGAIAVAAAGAFLLMLAIFGIRPDLAAAATSPVFWLKLAFPVATAAGAMWIAARLARPGLQVGRRWIAPAAPAALVWLGALATLALAPAPERLALVLGASWRTCPFNIALLAVPGLAAALWAMRGMAPTRLRAAGAAAGLLASAVATVVYCLHCPEMAVAFWAVWYVAGMLIPAALGAWLGPRVLRW